MFDQMASFLDCLDGTAYAVDRHAVIRACGPRNWSAFALDNDAPELADPAAVLGRDLFDFILGHRIKTVYRQHLDRLATTAEIASVVLPYSCDAPTFDRQMRMAITRIIDGGTLAGFLFHSVLLSEDMRPPIDIYDFNALRKALSDQRVLPLLAMCSFCQRVRVPVGASAGEGHWVSAETYYREGGDSRVRISHTVCTACWHRQGTGPIIP